MMTTNPAPPLTRIASKTTRNGLCMAQRSAFVCRDGNDAELPVERRRCRDISAFIMDRARRPARQRPRRARRPRIRRLELAFTANPSVHLHATVNAAGMVVEETSGRNSPHWVQSETRMAHGLAARTRITTTHQMPRYRFDPKQLNS